MTKHLQAAAAGLRKLCWHRGVLVVYFLILIVQYTGLEVMIIASLLMVGRERSLI